MPIDSITIGAGDSAWLPKGATILSVTATEGLTLSSPSGCINTAVPPSKCWEFVWETYSPTPTELNSSVFTGIKIDGITYTFNPLKDLEYNDPDDILTEIPRVCVFSTIATFTWGDPNRVTITLPDSMDAPMLLFKNDTEVEGVFEYGAILAIETVCP